MTEETTLRIDHPGIRANFATEIERETATELKRLIEIGIEAGEWSDETEGYARMIATELDWVDAPTDKEGITDR